MTGYVFAFAILSSTSGVALGDNARLESCRNKLKAAQKLNVLHDLQWTSGHTEPRVVVGPTFMSMAIDGKEGFASTVNCFLMGGRTDCVSFDLVHWQSGKAVGRFERCRYRPK